jgi:hypothetical protein
MLTFTKTKNTRLPDSVHNAGVTLQSRDILHTLPCALPSPIFYERAPTTRVRVRVSDCAFYFCLVFKLQSGAIEIVSFSFHILFVIFHYNGNSLPHALVFFCLRLRFTACDCKACSAIFRLC